MNKPFVSFIVMSYKAEKFIQEAIDGAFAQTYDNMEIIFSDDASPDKTFEIIEENVRNYTGKHKVNITINRNEKNMGIGAHLNKLWWQMAKGDWIVVSAGDDISIPCRTEKLMSIANENVSLIHHNFICIDSNSNIISNRNNFDYSKVIEVFNKNDIEETIRKGLFVLGSTMCINKKVLDIFGPFNKEIVNEDVILAYRAQYVGKIIHLDDELLKYRMHVNSISYQHNYNYYKQFVEFKKNSANQFIAVYRQILSDHKILKLSDSLLKELSDRKLVGEIDLFLYSSAHFRFSYFKNKRFFFRLSVRLLLKPILFFKRKLKL